MKAVGIIAEFNPFHNGHRFILNHAKHKSQAEVLIVVMSGNFLQRGEPAIITKWQRTKAALAAGADLVIELPFVSAIESAENFASGAINLLHDFRCDSLCFGTEKGEALPYDELAAFYHQNEDSFNLIIKKKLEDNIPYGIAVTQTWEELTASRWPTFDLRQPNILLGFHYALANHNGEHPMELLPLNRIGANHNDATATDESFASGTAIRQLLLRGEKSNSYIPLSTQTLLEDTDLHSWEDYWPLLHYQLCIQSPENLAKLHNIVEGIEYRLIACAKKASSFAEWLSQVKTKRYTTNRIQRMALSILIQLTEDEFNYHQQRPYHHVLGMTKKGQAYLGHYKKVLRYPLISTFSKAPAGITNLDERATTLYQLPFNKLDDNDYTNGVIRV